jgi:hypothetical protein
MAFVWKIGPLLVSQICIDVLEPRTYMQVCLFFSMGASIRGCKEGCKYVNLLIFFAATRIAHLQDKAFNVKDTVTHFNPISSLAVHILLTRI